MKIDHGRHCVTSLILVVLRRPARISRDLVIRDSCAMTMEAAMFRQLVNLKDGHMCPAT